MIKVLSVNANSKVSFTRAIRPNEEKDYGQTISDAKKLVGVKNIALVLHGSSFPQSDKDLFIGSPINSKAVEVNDFLKMHGFDSIQLGPPGLVSKENTSPYSSSINSKNYLFADMTQLTKKEYANILDSSDIDAETSKDYSKSTMTDFEKAFDSYDRLYETAYDNLKVRGDDEAIKLKTEYKNFIADSGDWIETDAMYDVLQKKYNSPDFDKWPDVAKNLIQYKNDPEHLEHEEALALISEMKKNNSKEMGLYKFKQFIVDKQEKQFISENPNKLQYISDAIIGFSVKDMWANQDAFLEDYRVGCPYGGAGYPEGEGTPRGANQMWDIPVINPKTLFKKDGSLGKGGELFKQKFEKLLDTYQNIRIDHALGLVDPWIYNKNNVQIRKNDQKQIIYTNANGANISNFGRENTYPVQGDEYTKNIYRDMNNNIAKSEVLDPNHDYSKILEKILLPILEDKDLKPNELVWENLGCPTKVFDDVYYNKLRLPGLFSLKNAQAENKGQNDWFLISSHDDPPFSQVASDGFFEEKKYNGGPMNPDYLVGYLHPEKTNEERQPIMKDLSWNTRLRVITKNQELIRSAEKIQISFMDFFGLDKTYNKMGTSDENNWKLRLSKNYKKDYYKTLENQDWQKIALNMPELLKRAVISKIYTSNKPNDLKDKDFQAATSLINKLDYYEKVLYEPETEKSTCNGSELFQVV